MSREPGTIIASTEEPEVKLVYDPRQEGDSMGWKSQNPDTLLVGLFGDEGGEIRFSNEAVELEIERGNYEEVG